MRTTLSKRLKRETPPQPSPDRLQQLADRLLQHQQRLYVIGILAIMLSIGSFYWQNRQQQQNAIAQSELFQAIYYFEAGVFDKALQGDGVCAGLLDIIKEYGWTQAANLAHFYAGVSYLHQQEEAQAIAHLSQFKAQDDLLQARAWSLLGDAYTAQQAYAQATQYYMKAANYKPNKVFTPIYLIQAALVYETNQEYQKALSCYQRIVEKFPSAEQCGEARKHLARLQAMKAAL
ncbi:MAG: cytochrome C biosynthesis protein [Roseivirga sp.]